MTTRGFAMTRLLKRIGIVLAVLLVLVACVAFWLLRTESGLQFVLARAVGATAGKLDIGKSSGSLAGPVVIDDLRYRDPAAGADVHVHQATIAFSILELMSSRLHVTKLQLDGLDVALTTVTAPSDQKPAGDISLAAPLDVILDRLVLTKATITSDGEPLVALDSLDIVGRWTHDGIAVTSLALQSPDGKVDLHGTVSALAGYPGNGETTFSWKVAETIYAGALKATGDGKQARLELALTAPVPANVVATLTQAHDLPWTAKVDVPRFDPKRVQKDSTLAALALNLEGSGDRTHGALSGDVAVNDHHVQLEPLRYALAHQVLTIEALTLKSSDAAGTLNARGVVQLDAKPVSATLALDWNGVEIPADLAGQALASHGKLDASGSAERFQAQGTLSIGPPGKLADIALDIDGTPETIALKRLALVQAGNAGLDAQGTLTLKPALGWKLTAKATRLDPGAFAAQWPGALDFDLATSGTLTDKGPDATIKLDKIGGTLRKRPLSGSADIAIKPDYIVDGTVAIASGKSRIDVNGRGGNQTDATIKLAIASLGDWLPDAGGSLDGDFRVQGQWPKLAVSGSAHGSKIVSGTTQVGTLDVVANVASLQPPQGSASVKAAKITSGSLAFDTISLDGSGSQQAHELVLDAHGTPLAFKLALAGGAKDDGRWNGSLRTLDVTIKDAPPLALEQAAALGWDGKQFTASEICLAGGGPKVCVAGSGGADGSAAARYRIEQLPLALITKLAVPDAPFKAEGIIAGHGDVRRAANGALDGTATIGSDKGSVAYPDNAKPLIAYTGLSLDATLSPQSTHATLRAVLDHDGKLDGDVTLSGAAGSAQALSGHVDIALNSLAFIELLTPEVANTKGRLAANYTIAGTTAAPQLNGALTLKEFATEVPSAGLKLHDGDISVRATDADHFVLDGTLKSGDGTLTLSGAGGIGATAPVKASIKGENFLAADIPAAKVVISPDLVIERTASNITVGGSLTIPKTDVDLAKLPGGGVSKTSPDVVIVDAEQPAAGKPLPVIVAVEVKLGSDVKLAGLGLDGNISGQLSVNQRPGKLATGTGTLNVGGTYKAYGQDLSIETGRLLFAGTALDNPGLDIRAVRKILGASGGQSDDTTTVGLQIRGTALVPVLTVFSQPAMEQSEALSYLITGKPLSGLKSGEGDMLGSAARALGSAGGDLLAKGIGSRVGVEAGVSDNAALGGAAFTVGKYLSPKLYLSYGVGLFTPGEVVSLKYLFNKRWNFEAQNATTGNRAGINYRWEH